MQPGDLVRLKHGSLFHPNHCTVGTVVRMPLPPDQHTRLTDTRVMVQVGNDPRSRPMRPEQLEETGQAGTPLERITAMHKEWLAKRQAEARLKELEAIANTPKPSKS